MRQKFLIHKDNEKMELTIKEFANLDREIRSRELIKIDKEILQLAMIYMLDGMMSSFEQYHNFLQLLILNLGKIYIQFVVEKFLRYIHF